MSSRKYLLLGLDVRNESQLEDALGAAGLDWAAPTLILSEVVLTYMETQWYSRYSTCTQRQYKIYTRRFMISLCDYYFYRSDAVISWAAEHLPQSLFVMYEQIHPHDPFGRIMQEHFLKLNSALHGLQQYPDTSAQRRRFLDKAGLKTHFTYMTALLILQLELLLFSRCTFTH